ncbi:DUF6602 domain-containing protein [Microvirga tunisiensis]|uniref:DUF6602 domain-containing protein n=1 Tax=Microvirga tunisiensis TaxID=2108360 RepID=A0A5N7MKE5_9HYPH|nr:DUF6602 domain-containing protein [Microvirga tunisiensis]MPR09190.1 hypothetical protein [Microvirga tunisiensis]MPR27383.1 hypothetical protein [Microvirga tunisiensis]
MTEWNLANILRGLHTEIHRKLEHSRELFGHPVLKGDASENVWIELLGSYLPKRYSVSRATVVDSNGQFSQQIDVVVFDRQYTPFILTYQNQTVIPAEGVYAVFEAKQTIDTKNVAYAQEKAASVRGLHRTSLPVPHVSGVAKPKEPPRILAGLLTFESSWKDPFGPPLSQALASGDAGGTLDLGCVAAHGHFSRCEDGSYALTPEGKPATAFLFELIARLQASATVPMIDMRAYAKWLAD